jgi:tetratricopeptide (TPR) repeat protein
MIERDYLMRMIQMLAAVLAKVLLHRDLKQYDEALKEIDEAAERLIGIKWKFLHSLPDKQLIELLAYDENLNKMLVAAELLREESEILLEQGKTDESVVQGMKAFSLFAELVITEKSFLAVTSVEKFASLLRRLEDFEFPYSLEQKRFQYYEIRGDLASAEAVIADVFEKNPDIRDQGISFYRRMLKKTDKELKEGGLSREKIETGLAKLTSGKQRTYN